MSPVVAILFLTPLKLISGYFIFLVVCTFSSNFFFKFVTVGKKVTDFKIFSDDQLMYWLLLFLIVLVHLCLKHEVNFHLYLAYKKSNLL